MRIPFSAVTVVVFLLAGDSRADEKAADEGRVAAGEYVEVDAGGKTNADFTLTATEVTPNILLLRGWNGWVAFATYDASKKEYHGSFEFPRVDGRGPGGKWADLYRLRVAAQGGVLSLEGTSDKNEILIRAKPTEGGTTKK